MSRFIPDPVEANKAPWRCRVCASLVPRTKAFSKTFGRTCVCIRCFREALANAKQSA